MKIRKSGLWSLVFVAMVLACAVLPFAATGETTRMTAHAESLGSRGEKPVECRSLNDKPSPAGNLTLNKPDWKGGEFWGAGAKWDIAQMLNMNGNSSGSSGSFRWNVQGQIGYYWYAEVKEKATISIGGTNYEVWKVETGAYVGLAMTLDFAGSFSGQGFSTSFEGNGYALVDIRGKGALYLTTDTFSFAKFDYAVDANFDMYLYFKLILQGKDYTTKFDMQGKDIHFEIHTTWDPPLKYFDFPVWFNDTAGTGKQWWTNPTNMTVQGSSSGKLSVNVDVQDNIFGKSSSGVHKDNVDLTNNFGPATVSVPALPLKCTGTRSVEVVRGDGKKETVTVFIIQLDMSKYPTSFRQHQLPVPVPSQDYTMVSGAPQLAGGVGATGSGSTVSGASIPSDSTECSKAVTGESSVEPMCGEPEQQGFCFEQNGYVVSQESAYGTGSSSASANTQSCSKTDVDSFASDPDGSLPAYSSASARQGSHRGNPMILIRIIVIVIIAVVIVVAVVLIMRRKKRHAQAVYPAPPGIQPTPVMQPPAQPLGQQYPAQQYQYQPQLQPQQPYQYQQTSQQPPPYQQP